MLKYATIINSDTKQCDIGFGTNIKYYKSMGMAEQEVEQGYDGNWYLKGYAPQKPQSIVNEEEIVEYKKFLADTDYVVVKIAEAISSEDDELVRELKRKYAEILIKRREARDNINIIEVEEKLK